MTFKSENKLENREAESKKIIAKYPDRIPIIVEKSKNNSDVPEIDKKKIFSTCRFNYGTISVCCKETNKIKTRTGFIFIY